MKFSIYQESRKGARKANQDRVGYSYSFGSRASFFASLSRTNEFTRDSQIFVGVLLTLDRATTLHVSAQQEQGRGAWMQN